MRHYLVDRGYILKYDLKQLSQIEEWYKDASKLNEEAVEMIKAVRAKKNLKNKLGQPAEKKSEVQQLI